jgi:hypothetical protein
LFHILSITERAALMTYKKAAEQFSDIVSNLCIGGNGKALNWNQQIIYLLKSCALINEKTWVNIFRIKIDGT